MATELAMALARRGHEIHMIAVEKPFRLIDGYGVRFHELNVTDYPLFRYPPHDLCLANRIAEVVMQHDIQIIHAHYAVPHAIAAILASDVVRPHPVRVVTTLHGTDITLVGSHRDFYRVCRYAMLKADGLSAVSSWLSQQTVREFSLPSPPVAIPNFVDCDRFNSQGRAVYPTDGEFQILHASNFRPVKRVCDVIRAFHRLRQHLPARLTLAGAGPELGMARELAGELGICGHVEIVSPTIHMEELYRRSHLFLLLSDYESFGLSALEAMACGTPVVGTRSGGMPEVVEDGVSGHLCRVGDIEQIVQAARQILQSPESWDRYSQCAITRATEHFCRHLVVPHYEAFYQGVLDRAAASNQ